MAILRGRKKSKSRTTAPRARVAIPVKSGRYHDHPNCGSKKTTDGDSAGLLNGIFIFGSFNMTMPYAKQAMIIMAPVSMVK